MILPKSGQLASVLFGAILSRWCKFRYVGKESISLLNRLLDF